MGLVATTDSSRPTRLAKPTKIALIVIWVVVGMFVLGDFSEIVRGDSSFNTSIPWNLLGGLTLSAATLAIQGIVRLVRTRLRRHS